MPAITINFPKPNDVVHGRGGLYSWGTHDESAVSGITEAGVTFENDDGEEETKTFLPEGDAPDDNSWAFAFEGLPFDGRDLTLVVVGQDHDDPSNPVESDPVPFSCAGHLRLTGNLGGKGKKSGGKGKSGKGKMKGSRGLRGAAQVGKGKKPSGKGKKPGGKRKKPGGKRKKRGDEGEEE